MAMKIIVTLGYTNSVRSTLISHTPSRGPGGMFHRKILKNKCYKIESGSNFGQ